jgi:hypothetical protein
MKFSKTVQLATMAVMLVPLAAQACDEPAKKGDDNPVYEAGDMFRVYPGWRWKQDGATSACRWQLLVDAGPKYIVRGSGKKTYKWLSITKITDPKYKDAKQYLKSNDACGHWKGQNRN